MVKVIRSIQFFLQRFILPSSNLVLLRFNTDLIYSIDLTQETTALSALSMTTQESAEPTAKLDLLAQSKITSRYSSPQVAQVSYSESSHLSTAIEITL